MAPQRIIIDTDPGVDDTLALLLALSTKPEELQVELISVTYGNVEVNTCLRNVVSLFHHIEQEQAWRRQNGKPEGFETLNVKKPIVAIGPSEPLGEQMMIADYFHGIDGLGGIYESHPHLSPPEIWRNLFASTRLDTSTEKTPPAKLFTPSDTPAHVEILHLLETNEPNTITLIAVGPLTTFALAAALDPEVFLRAKEVVVMGGAVMESGNVCVWCFFEFFTLLKSSCCSISIITLSYHSSPLLSKPPTNNPPGPPTSEFNTFADSIAAARVMALTSPSPSSTLPPGSFSYPSLPSLLRLTLLPLDITSKHHLTRRTFFPPLTSLTSPDSPSPLAIWASAFMDSTFTKVETLHHSTPGLTLHDPLCVWYVLHGGIDASESEQSSGREQSSVSEATSGVDETETDASFTTLTQDIRVETLGQWTRGMMIVDRRDRKKLAEGVLELSSSLDIDAAAAAVQDQSSGKTAGQSSAVPTTSASASASDHGSWLSDKTGNRVRRLVKTPGNDAFVRELLGRVFGVDEFGCPVGCGLE